MNDSNEQSVQLPHVMVPEDATSEKHESFLIPNAVIISSNTQEVSISDLFGLDIDNQNADEILTEPGVPEYAYYEHNGSADTEFKPNDDVIAREVTSEEPRVFGVSEMPDNGTIDNLSIQPEFEAKSRAMLKVIGQNIKAARKKAGLSQGQYASKIGISRATLCKVESGAVTESEIFIRAAMGLNVSILCAEPDLQIMP